MADVESSHDSGDEGVELEGTNLMRISSLYCDRRLILKLETCIGWQLAMCRKSCNQRIYDSGSLFGNIYISYPWTS